MLVKNGGGKQEDPKMRTRSKMSVLVFTLLFLCEKEKQGGSSSSRREWREVKKKMASLSLARVALIISVFYF